MTEENTEEMEAPSDEEVAKLQQLGEMTYMFLSASDITLIQLIKICTNTIVTGFEGLHEQMPEEHVKEHVKFYQAVSEETVRFLTTMELPEGIEEYDENIKKRMDS